MRNATIAKGVRLASMLCALSLLVGCASFERCGAAGCAGDRAITARVRAVFEQHPALEGPNRVSVQTVDGVVYLRGIVDTPYEKRLAVSLAQQIPGVGDVVDLIGLNNER